MNNKFIKRVSAVVLGVAVLSTCAFAAKVNAPTEYINANRTLTYYITGNGATSFIAYATNKTDGTTETDDPIVAVDQFDHTGEENVTGSVTIDAAKLVGKDKIVVKSGDQNGRTPDYEVLNIADYVSKCEVTKFGENAKFTATNGTVYENVPQFKVVATANKEGYYIFDKFVAKYTEGNEPKEHPLSNIIQGDLFELLSKIKRTAGSDITLDNVYVIGAPEAAVDNMTIEIVTTYSATKPTKQ